MNTEELFIQHDDSLRPVVRLLAGVLGVGLASCAILAILQFLPPRVVDGASNIALMILLIVVDGLLAGVCVAAALRGQVPDWRRWTRSA